MTSIRAVAVLSYSCPDCYSVVAEGPLMRDTDSRSTNPGLEIACDLCGQALQLPTVHASYENRKQNPPSPQETPQ